MTVFDTSPDIHVPLLVIGTKQDLESNRAGSLPVHQRRSHIAEDYVSEEIHLNCTGDFGYVISSKVLLKELSEFYNCGNEKVVFNKDRYYSKKKKPLKKKSCFEFKKGLNFSFHNTNILVLFTFTTIDSC